MNIINQYDIKVNLNGSEKQVKWAESIMLDLINKAHLSYDTYKESCDISPDEVMRYFERAVKELVPRHKDASWWIDHRYESILPEIDEIVTGLYEADQASAKINNDKLWEEYYAMEEEKESDWVERFGTPEDNLRKYYQGIVDEIEAQGGPKVKDLPNVIGFQWRGDGKDHTQEMLYNDAKEWLASHRT